MYKNTKKQKHTLSHLTIATHPLCCKQKKFLLVHENVSARLSPERASTTTAQRTDRHRLDARDKHRCSASNGVCRSHTLAARSLDGDAAAVVTVTLQPPPP